MDGTSHSLVIVPCGRAKIWDSDPSRGAVAARDAYTGGPFVLNRTYAERFGDAWVVLSAKYGFIPPDFAIPAAYETTFKRAATRPVAIQTLRQQVASLGLDRYPVVIGLGGKEYRAAVEAAFAGYPPRLVFPFAGLPIGKAMQATKRSIESGHPGFEAEER